MTVKEHRVSFYSDANILKSTVVMTASICDYTHTSWVNYMVYG